MLGQGLQAEGRQGLDRCACSKGGGKQHGGGTRGHASSGGGGKQQGGKTEDRGAGRRAPGAGKVCMQQSTRTHPHEHLFKPGAPGGVNANAELLKCMRHLVLQ